MREEEVGKEIDKRNARSRKDKEWGGGRTGRDRGKTGKKGTTVEGYSSSKPDLGWWEKNRGWPQIRQSRAACLLLVMKSDEGKWEVPGTRSHEGQVFRMERQHTGGANKDRRSRNVSWRTKLTLCI